MKIQVWWLLIEYRATSNIEIFFSKDRETHEKKMAEVGEQIAGEYEIERRDSDEWESEPTSWLEAARDDSLIFFEDGVDELDLGD